MSGEHSEGEAAAANPPATTTLALAPTDVLRGTEDDPFDSSQSLFSTRKPRNAAAGVSSGLKSVAKGVGMGAVGLVAAPVIGAKENGAKGFVAGLGAGIIGAVALPVYGAVLGAVQVTRGVLNTPEAVAERGRGKIWDEDTRTWVSYDLNEEARQMLAMTEEEWCTQHGIKADGGSGSGEGRSGKVKETELYDALGVESDASSAAIRKAYFKLAKELHPDKNLDDPDAHARFQAVGEAYQVLSNDELRAKYDASGKAALDASSLVDPMQFFAMLFGSEPFEYLVGELKLATMFAAGGEGMANEQFMAYKQKRREVLCALTLKGLLAQFCSGDEAEFEAEMHGHAKRLQEAPVGPALVWTCGYIYENKGLQALGGLDAIGSNARQTMHTAAANMRVAGAAINTYRAYRKDVSQAKKEEEKKEKEGKEKEGKEKEGKEKEGKEKEGKEKEKEGKEKEKKGKEKEGKEKKEKDGAGKENAGKDGRGKGAKEPAGGKAGGGEGSGAAAEGSSTSEPPALTGKIVLISGLKGRADLNGKAGMAVTFDQEAGRYTVRLADGECIKVRPTNLQLVEEEEEEGTSGAAGAAGKAEEGEEEGMAGQPSEDTMNLMLEAMWRVSMLDIESTLRHACNKVLSDQSADKVHRKNRARGLVVMGRVFQAYGSADALKTINFASHMRQAGERYAERVAAQSTAERPSPDYQDNYGRPPARSY